VDGCDILMLALKLEKGALDFYSKAQEKVRDKKDFYKRVAGLVGDSEARNMLHELAGEERNHIKALLLQIEEPKGGGQE